MNKRNYLTPREYASLHGCHYNSVLKWIHCAWIPSALIRQGGRVRYYIPVMAQPPRKKPGPPRSAGRRERSDTLLLLRTALKLRVQAAELQRAQRKEH